MKMAKFGLNQSGNQNTSEVHIFINITSENNRIMEHIN